MVKSDCHIELDGETSTISTQYSSSKNANPFDGFDETLEILLEPNKNAELFSHEASKNVSFYESVEVLLIPSRHEYIYLFQDLWYTFQDFHGFEIDAYYEQLDEVDQTPVNLESNDLPRLINIPSNDLFPDTW